MPPLISHEIPESLFPFHDLINDYPYILGHLVGDNLYTEFYIRNLKKHKFSILDNGLHELGRPLSIAELTEIINHFVMPSHVVLPDYFHDDERTFEESKQMASELRQAGVNVNMMAVAQAPDFESTLTMIDKLSGQILRKGDILAIPFRCSNEGHPNLRRAIFIKKYLQVSGLSRLARLGIKVHLLGCEDAGEFALYSKEELNLIYSIDTSAPIIHGWKGLSLTRGGGHKEKPKEKLADNLDIEFDGEQIELIVDNIKQFRGYFKC